MQAGTGIRRLGALVLALIAALALIAISAGSAPAAPPSLLGQFPEDISAGDGANQLDNPRAIGINPSNGHVYVAEIANNRISEFDAWGAFVKAWGWGVQDESSELQTCGPTEPEIEPPPGLCKSGVSGAGAGQLNLPNGVAIDASGDLYIAEMRDNLRVQKFSPAGEFLLMFGGEVNKSTTGDICTKTQLEGGDECGKGVAGSAPGWFTRPGGVWGNPIAIAADGSIYVGDHGRIQVFEADGTYQDELPLPEDEDVAALALDPVSGDLYFSYRRFSGQQVYRLDAETGALLDELPIDISPSTQGRVEALATDPNGNLFATILAGASSVVEFGPQGEELIVLGDEFARYPEQGEAFTANLTALATNSLGDLYVGRNDSALPPDKASSIVVYGPPPIDYGPPPSRPPLIAEQFATSIGTTGATVRARINPRFWADTSYYVEYGTEDCGANACQQTPAPPGATLSNEVVSSPLATDGVFLPGLQPDTTYHYRFVSESGGGGPVYGADRTFKTRVPAPPQAPCPANGAYRIAAAAQLPDCRAYEMVSPVNKNGADISVVYNSVGDATGLDRVATDGNAISYSAYRAFGDVESSPYTSQYLAKRGGDGWLTKGISPPRSTSLLVGVSGLDSQYKGFSADLCSGWLLQDSDVSLASGSVPGWPNVYRRDLCAAGYEPLAPLTVPLSGEAKDFRPEVQGYSADGARSFVRSKNKLASNGTAAVEQLYEAAEGQLRLVCVLPNGTAVTVACSAGSAGEGGVRTDRSATLTNAVSTDGSIVYWSESQSAKRLFVRLNHTQTKAVSSSGARFWAAAADGSTALYSEGTLLRAFDLQSSTSKLVATGFLGLLGASDDASVAYLASEDELAPGATVGQPNLFRYDATVAEPFEFIATLSAQDVDPNNGIPSNVAGYPIRHFAQATPDGDALAFVSNAELTGYENIDAESGERDAEVFVYRAGPDSLACVSCNPTGARPSGRDLKSELGLPTSFWAAARLPLAYNQLTFPRVISEDGDRVYFESFDPLVLRDNNSQQDVYQWEATGTGTCTASAPGYQAALGGCVDLISSGESPAGASFVDASADGRDVFFKTYSSLWPEDPDLLDIYDARVGGGFPLPAPPPPSCQGEACQNPAAPPSDPTPSSQTFVGPGNGVYCRKGTHKVKRKGKVRCVKNKSKKKRHKRKHTRHSRKKQSAKQRGAAR